MVRHLKSALSLVFLLLGAPMVLAQGKDNDNAPRRLSSWTSDRREYAVGDIITVLVSEATLASATKSQTGTDQQTRANDVGINPPKIGTTALPTIDADISMNKSSASKQNGAAQRGVNFRGDISVRVVAVDKSGLMQIKGTKLVDVDKNKQQLNLSGWVRPEDVTMQNFVASERVADISLTYQLSGNLGKTRGGIIGRLLTVFWP
jgi:flagellar L-ring protein precursor FlgH